MKTSKQVVKTTVVTTTSTSKPTSKPSSKTPSQSQSKKVEVQKVVVNSDGDEIKDAFELFDSNGEGKINVREINYQTSSYNRNENFKINDFESKIEEYEVKESFIYQYEECLDNKCNTYSKIVKPKLNNVVLRLKIKNANLYPSEFINNSFGLVYDKEEVGRKKMEVIAFNNDDYYFSVPKDIINAKNINLKIKTRDLEYIIKIKDDNNE